MQLEPTTSYDQAKIISTPVCTIPTAQLLGSSFARAVSNYGRCRLPLQRIGFMKFPHDMWVLPNLNAHCLVVQRALWSQGCVRRSLKRASVKAFA
jgi:hypothetical protein